MTVSSLPPGHSEDTAVKLFWKLDALIYYDGLEEKNLLSLPCFTPGSLVVYILECEEL